MKKKLLLSILILLFLMSACQKKEPQIEIPLPATDMAVIHGQILNQEGVPLKNTPVRLADVYRGEDDQGAFALDEAFSPASLSDENGNFIFSDLKPGEYVLFVGSINSNYMIVANDDESAIVYKVSPNEVLEIKPINVDFE